MRVHREKRQVERLVSGGELRQRILRHRDGFLVLHPPPDLVVLRNDPLLLGVDIVTDLKIAVLLKIQPPAAERGVRSEHEDLPVPFVLQQVSHRRDLREEACHRGHGVPLDVDVERESRCHAENRAHRPGRARKRQTAVQLFPVCAREVFVLLRELCNFRNHILIKIAAFGLVRERHFGGFHIDLNQIPLLFRKRELHLRRIHIMVLDKVRLGVPVPDVVQQLHFAAEIDHRKDEHARHRREADAGDPAVMRLLSARHQQQNRRSRTDQRRNEALDHIVRHHIVSRAFQRRLQLIDDFIHRKTAPLGQNPAERQHGNHAEKGKNREQNGQYRPPRFSFMSAFFFVFILCVTQCCTPCPSADRNSVSQKPGFTER